MLKKFALIGMLVCSCATQEDTEKQEQIEKCDELVDTIAYRWCGADLFTSKSDALNDPECQRTFGKLITQCYENVSQDSL